MNIRTCLIVLAAFLFSVTYAAPLKSNALVSEIVPSTIGQKSVAPSILDTLRDVYIANPIDTISPRTVADDSIAPVHTVALSARVNDMTTGISKNMTSPAAISAPDTEPHWKNSLQILFREHQGYFSWYMYQGPQGVPVNPCGDNRFAIITRNYRENRKGLSLMEPPMVGEGTKWYINTMDGWSDRDQCFYEAAADDPGHLVCGDFFDFPVSKDAGYYSKPIRCAGGKWADGTYHRAWAVEY
jgi:hypothetical protein